MKPYTEDQAVRALERIAERWPSSLGLFSWSGALCVVRLDNGFPSPMEPAVIAKIHGIRNDGGDPD